MEISSSLSICRQAFLHLHFWYNRNAKGSCSGAQSVSLSVDTSAKMMQSTEGPKKLYQQLITLHEFTYKSCLGHFSHKITLLSTYLSLNNERSNDDDFCQLVWCSLFSGITASQPLVFILLAYVLMTSCTTAFLSIILQVDAVSSHP